MRPGGFHHPGSGLLRRTDELHHVAVGVLHEDLAKAGGDKGKAGRFGQGSNLAYWFNRGYSTGNPKSCNTWTASSSKVA